MGGGTNIHGVLLDSSAFARLLHGAQKISLMYLFNCHHEPQLLIPTEPYGGQASGLIYFTSSISCPTRLETLDTTWCIKRESETRLSSMYNSENEICRAQAV